MPPPAEEDQSDKKLLVMPILWCSCLQVLDQVEHLCSCAHVLQF